MPTKRPSNAKVPPPSEADDFKLIKGINTMIENRLHKAGILTYEQLAALSPAEVTKRVGKLTGVNGERIKEQNWVGQARDLAGQVSSSLASKEVENVGFVVDLFLDQTKQVRLTQVLNVKCGVGDTWDGWDEKRLLNFFIEQSQMQLPTAKPAFAAPSAATRSKPQPAMAETKAETKTVMLPASVPTFGKTAVAAAPALAAPSPEQLLRELQVISAQTLRPTGLLKRGELFYLQLELNSLEQLQQKAVPLYYTATIYAKRWEDQSRFVLGESHGEIDPTHNRIKVESLRLELQPGVYSLTASLIVAESEKGAKPHPIAHSSLADRMFQVQ